MIITKKPQRTSGGAFYFIAFGVVIGCLLSCLLYSLLGERANADVVFLRTTFPLSQEQDGISGQAYEDVSSLFVEPETAQEPVQQPSMQETEDRLIAMLQQDDLQVAYEGLPEKEKWQTVRMRVTGYCSCPKCCGKFSDGVTASAHRIQKGDVFVAADKCYRFGTEMVIPGYNQALPVKVLDRGRVIKGNRIDLYFDSHQEAQKWGVQYLDVLVKTAD